MGVVSVLPGGWGWVGGGASFELSIQFYSKDVGHTLIYCSLTGTKSKSFKTYPEVDFFHKRRGDMKQLG